MQENKESDELWQAEHMAKQILKSCLGPAMKKERIIHSGRVNNIQYIHLLDIHLSKTVGWISLTNTASEQTKGIIISMQA